MITSSRAVLPAVLIQHPRLNPKVSLTGLANALFGVQLRPQFACTFPGACWLLNVVTLKGFVADTTMVAV
jgi:hypothetical protein